MKLTGRDHECTVHKILCAAACVHLCMSVCVCARARVRMFFFAHVYLSKLDTLIIVYRAPTLSGIFELCSVLFATLRISAR